MGLGKVCGRCGRVHPSQPQPAQPRDLTAAVCRGSCLWAVGVWACLGVCNVEWGLSHPLIPSPSIRPPTDTPKRTSHVIAQHQHQHQHSTNGNQPRWFRLPTPAPRRTHLATARCRAIQGSSEYQRVLAHRPHCARRLSRSPYLAVALALRLKTDEVASQVGRIHEVWTERTIWGRRLERIS